MEANADAVRLVKPYVDAGDATNLASAKTYADGKLATLFKGAGDNLPTAADRIGQLFIKTGATNPGLYVSTGTTTPGWKAVSYEAE